MSDKPYHALSVIPDIDKKILEGIAAGRSLKAIADEYGVTDAAILHRATRNYPEAYRAAADVGYQLRMDKRESELESADNNVSVTRADRLLGHARWLAERSCPDRWGAKQTVQAQVIVADAGLVGTVYELLASGIAQQMSNATQAIECKRDE